MELPSSIVFTHDSIGVGEDGPTHQPIEQLARCAAIPGLITLRPGDANEVVEAWRGDHGSEAPAGLLVLSRQALPTFDRKRYAAAGASRKAPTCSPTPDGKPEVILIGTGSEVSLCVEALRAAKREGVRARVVDAVLGALRAAGRGLPRQVLPPAVTARVAVEQASTIGWDRYVGRNGAKIGMHSFGASAPLKDC